MKVRFTVGGLWLIEEFSGERECLKSIAGKTLKAGYMTAIDSACKTLGIHLDFIENSHVEES